MLKKLREPVNGLTHFFAAITALIGMIILLIISWGSLNKALALTVYSVSLVLLFTASATYHMVKAKPKVMEILRKLDHSAIYLLIAGTYTPFCAIMVISVGWNRCQAFYYQLTTLAECRDLHRDGLAVYHRNWGNAARSTALGADLALDRRHSLHAGCGRVHYQVHELLARKIRFP